MKIWRQANRTAKGRFVDYQVTGIAPDMSFLEMLDVLNEHLVLIGDDPVFFDHDCREGICGACSLFINGRPHGKGEATTTCQLYMRRFKDGETIVVEPFRAKAFPVIKDLTVDRSAFDQIIQAGGYVSCHTGGVPDGNAIPVTIISREYSLERKPGTESYYPIGDAKNNALYAKYRELADAEERFTIGGRLGEYRYYDMDVAIARALEMTDRIPSK